METDNQPVDDLVENSPAVPLVAPPADPPADPPVDPPADLPVDPSADRLTDSLLNLSAMPTDQSMSSLVGSSGKVCPSPSFSRRKPAPMPPALEALSRRPTQSTPPGKSMDTEEMQTQSSLKRKPATTTTKKVVGPKKGKH